MKILEDVQPSRAFRQVLPRIAALALLLAVSFALHPATVRADEVLSPEATLRSVAHANGLRGGDLAAALGLARQTDKERSLVETGVTAGRLRRALASLGVPEPVFPVDEDSAPELDTSMTIRQIARRLGINGAELAFDLRLSVEVDRDTPLARFGVSREALRRAVEHNLSHEETGAAWWKYPITLAIVLFALMYLLKWGIPRGADPKKRKRYYPRLVFVAIMIGAVLVLGVWLGKSPNPMEGAVKAFKATVGLYESVGGKLALFAFFLALAVVANKAICGWACPFGALEELLYMLPLFRRIKRRHLPFWVSNSIRTALFAAFLLTFYGIVGQRKGFVLYHYLNPFNLFNLDFSTRMVPVAIGVYLAASLVFYRPFCQFICPFGFLSWIAERASLTRVRIDFTRCIACGSCAEACPLTAAKDRLEKRRLPADCFSCMRCLRVCPADAIHYRPAWGPPSPPSPLLQSSVQRNLLQETRHERRRHRSGR